MFESYVIYALGKTMEAGKWGYDRFESYVIYALGKTKS